MSPFRRNAQARRAAREAGFDVDAAAEALSRLRPGEVCELTHWHEASCRKPQGGPCTCKAGPRVELRPFLDPTEN